MMWALLKNIPLLIGLLLVASLCCAVLVLQLNLSAGISDTFTEGEGPDPIVITPEPDYGAAYCDHINQGGAGNPFNGWPAQDPLFHNEAFITMQFCDPTYPFSWAHEGLDFGFYLDSAVVATADAYIVEAGYDTMLGNMVLLCNGEWCARYGHMNSLTISVADEFVSQGDVIGFTGATGNAFGVHLHYDIFNSEGFWDPHPTLE